MPSPVFVCECVCVSVPVCTVSDPSPRATAMDVYVSYWNAFCVCERVNAMCGREGASLQMRMFEVGGVPHY